MSHRRMPKTNRWDCLKPENSSEDSGNDNKRVNRFKGPQNRAPTNSRWKRSNSPEVRINTFKNRRRGPMVDEEDDLETIEEAEEKAFYI